MVELLNTRDIARMYHVTSATVLNWIRAGKLKAYTTPGGHYRVAREDLDAFQRDYGAPPGTALSEPDLRLLLVGADAGMFEQVHREICSRWPDAQVQQARSEFEVGWWLARLRPTHILVHPAVTNDVLLNHCRQLTLDAGVPGLQLSTLPERLDERLGEWVKHEFNLP